MTGAFLNFLLFNLWGILLATGAVSLTPALVAMAVSLVGIAMCLALEAMS